MPCPTPPRIGRPQNFRTRPNFRPFSLFANIRGQDDDGGSGARRDRRIFPYAFVVGDPRGKEGSTAGQRGAPVAAFPRAAYAAPSAATAVGGLRTRRRFGLDPLASLPMRFPESLSLAIAKPITGYIFDFMRNDARDVELDPMIVDHVSDHSRSRGLNIGSRRGGSGSGKTLYGTPRPRASIAAGAASCGDTI